MDGSSQLDCRDPSSRRTITSFRVTKPGYVPSVLDDTLYDISSAVDYTRDIHRVILIALNGNIKFHHIPKDMVSKAEKFMLTSGFPIVGHEFAYHGRTSNHDITYVRSCALAGHFLPRKVYSMHNGMRFVDNIAGSIGLSACYMGPLSPTGKLLGLTKIEWRRYARIETAQAVLRMLKIKHEVKDDEIFIEGFMLKVSGHVLNAIINVALLGTDFSMAYDLNHFVYGFIKNQWMDVESEEPTYKHTAFHSALEVFIAVVAAMKVIRRLKGVVKLDREAVALATNMCRLFLTNLRFNKRTTHLTYRDKLSELDQRWYSPWSKLGFIVMPMGTGKSTLAKTYPEMFLDIDDVEKHWDEQLKSESLARKHVAVDSGDWVTFNNWYWPHLRELVAKSLPCVVLLHHIDTANWIAEGAPNMTIKLTLEYTKKNIISRTKNKKDLPFALKVMEINWNDVKDARIAKDYVELNEACVSFATKVLT